MDTIAVRFRLTVEQVLWLMLLGTTALTRLWDLGYRTQHHDEGLHTTFSWGFSTGEHPYVHHPLTHGPFLFHANALIYQLFGGSDATSRLLPAVTGVAIVAAPWLLRGRAFLGRWGALATGTFLLFSPAFLYYTRFIRHDPYTALGSLLLIVAVFRYFQRPHRKWIILAFVDVAFLLTNHEIVFAILLAFVIILWGALELSRLRMLIPVHLAAAVLLAATSALDWGPFPEIPWQTCTTEAARSYYGQLFRHPLVIGLLLLGIGFIASCVYLLRKTGKAGAQSGEIIKPLLGDANQGSVAKGVYDAWNDPVSVGLGALLGLWIFFGLFTTLFTNVNGIATATYATNGTLLYWLGQHDVRRGSQPWFYFIVEGVQYEWLVIVLGFAGLSILGVTLVRRLAARDFSYDPRILFRVLITFWMVFIFLVLSWAGEKMPWLIMHIVLPAALVSGTVIEDVVASISHWSKARTPLNTTTRSMLIAPAMLALGIVVLAASFFLIAANLTQGGFGSSLEATQRSVPNDRLEYWWILLLPVVASIAAFATVWIARGRRPAMYGTVGGLLAIMLLFQIHAGLRVSFLDADGAVDTLIYNTVGPDAKQVVEDVIATSELYLGDDSITVSNDYCTNWPLKWYFKDMPNYMYLPDLSGNITDLPNIIIGTPDSFTDDTCAKMPDEISGYTSQTYVFRWHEPQSQIYRRFAIAPEVPMGESAWVSETQDTGLMAIGKSVWSSITSVGDPDQQQKLWRLLMYREIPGPTTDFRFKVYVHNDILPYFNEVRYGR